MSRQLNQPGLHLESPSPPRSPWQWLYGGAHRLRRHWWSSRSGRLPRPVISVGNLHWGGSGKTPLVAALAAHLRDGGRRVAILSRGYGSEGKGTRVVSDGEGPLLGPRLAGDEPVLLAGQLPGVAVVVGPDRHRAGLQALERLDPQPEVFLLDDGFSHVRLARDLDLLAFPSADPFAGGRLAPGGRLREPLASARVADAVVLTGAPGDENLGPVLAKALRRHGFGGPGFRSETVVGDPRLVREGAPLSPCRVLAVSAIARPQVFLNTLRRLGFEIAEHLAFEDHHRYPESSLGKIIQAYEESHAQALLTTGKDMVKLRGRLDLPMAELPIVARPEPELFAWLDARLEEILAGGGEERK